LVSRLHRAGRRDDRGLSRGQKCPSYSRAVDPQCSHCLWGIHDRVFLLGRLFRLVSRPDPYGGIVDGGAAEGARGGGVGEGVDTPTAAMRPVLVQALGNEHARGQTSTDAGGEIDGAAAVADGHELALDDAEPSRIFGMEEDGGNALALLAAGRFVEGRVEEGAGRARGEAERVLGVGGLVDGPVV